MNKKGNHPTIYYIAGAGRSGSTLLDITIGNLSNHHSLGELIFFVENGLIKNEYCSCGQHVRSCSFWNEVAIKWEAKRILPIDVYQKTQKELLRNKNTIKNLFYSFFPTVLQRSYYLDQATLYQTLFKESGNPVLIDSSKNAQYILVLRRLPVKFKILHLTRSFSGVLNSTKKEFKKDPSQGLERDMHPQSFQYSLAIWLTDNLLTWLFALGKPYQRIRYEELIDGPEVTIAKIGVLESDEVNLLINRGPLLAPHLVAGNKMRMQNEIYIHSSRTIEKKSELNSWLNYFSNLIDLIFYW
ncbi:MAG: hypothetical protein P8O16_17315 [Algoriphagus sp.]|uniref:hypothetical protein n=1 Tax=Algoriphagus sp. TaxID=1872435 RepID=UPI002639B67E|nr:hypothetical protein [Algoriphagus sp.]MDG1279042.1 hypothetical protein [Algoriphagus sp.]